MMVFELLYLAMLLLRVAIWFVRVLVKLHIALILVAMPAGLLVRAGVVRDVDAFAAVSCAWAGLLLAAWFAAAAARRRGDAQPPRSRGSVRRARGGAPGRPVRA